MSTATRIEVDAIDFQIACRRFNIRATITRERQMPVVDEFVLRLLAVTERMPLSRLRAWFGFSEAEMETVLLDLGRRALVEFQGDDVILAAAGRDLFRGVSDDGVPQLVEVAPMLSDVWFDLVSRNMVPRSRPRQHAYLVRLREQPDARELPESFAREAFEANFRDYARRIRRFPDADSVNLYSISDVEGGRYGYQTLRAGVTFDPVRFSMRPSFPDLDDAPANFGKLTVAANDAWQMLEGSDVAPGTAHEYERMTGDQRLAGLFQDSAAAEAWGIALAPSSQEGFKATVGAIYLGANVDLLVDAIAAAGKTRESLELVWVRPNGSSWGRSLCLADAMQTIREATRKAGASNTRAALLVPRSTHKSIRLDHKRVFETGTLLPQGHLPTNLEVFLIPGLAALVNVHMPVGGRSVPIGGMVTDPKRLSRIEERLKTAGERWEDIWRWDPRKVQIAKSSQ
ncbi:hypothetical protein [Caulobacter endophyticus]|uniref:hypothetical protein n=1 Tax=Caulobacter endophyticus TaxID=2172652 RepID=UPI0011B1C81A|nr:hypothetical protein [Caulobacter endophyticus]